MRASFYYLPWKTIFSRCFVVLQHPKGFHRLFVSRRFKLYYENVHISSSKNGCTKRLTGNRVYVLTLRASSHRVPDGCKSWEVSRGRRIRGLWTNRSHRHRQTSCPSGRTRTMSSASPRCLGRVVWYVRLCPRRRICHQTQRSQGYRAPDGRQRHSPEKQTTWSTAKKPPVNTAVLFSELLHYYRHGFIHPFRVF